MEEREGLAIQRQLNAARGNINTAIQLAEQLGDDNLNSKLAAAKAVVHTALTRTMDLVADGQPSNQLFLYEEAKG